MPFFSRRNLQEQTVARLVERSSASLYDSCWQIVFSTFAFLKNNTRNRKIRFYSLECLSV